MSTWNWNGARWWKFDFHTHTPASEDYGKGTDQAQLRSRTPREWLLDFVRAGVDCVAVTDHNSGAWIDRLNEALGELRREQPEGFRQLHLFPGVEISVNGGIHVLALFDCQTTSAQVAALLGAVGFHGTFGRSDDVTTKSFAEVVAEIVRAGGIAIPAHVDENNGLLSTFSGTTLKQAIDCADLVAMELVDPAWTKPALYTDTRAAWTEVLGSDSHHPAGNAGQKYPGGRFTWVKMSRPSIEGLRLALLDGSLSVKRSDEISDDPNDHGALAIENVEIAEARYMGRSSRSFSIALNPWLNAVIGGRGTGKSTVVEFVRTVLDRERELPPALASDYEKYRKPYENRSDEGLLTKESQFDVIYRKDGTRYRIAWTSAAKSSIIHVDDGVGGWRPEQGDVAQRFPVRIYSQKQIFELAKDPLALMRIVDEAAAVNRSKWEADWRVEENRYLSLQADARRREAELGDEGRLLGELADVTRKLEAFEGTDHAAVLKEYQRRQREAGAVKKWESSWQAAAGRVRETAQSIVPPPLARDLFDASDNAAEDLLGKASYLVSGFARIRERLDELASEVEMLSQQWSADRDSSPWNEAVKSAADAYRELQEKLKAQGAGDPSVYGELVKRRQEVESRLAEIRRSREELDGIRQQASDCLDRLLKLRQNLTSQRKGFIETVLAQNPYVRIRVVPYGAREAVEQELRGILQRETGFEKDIGSPDGGDSMLGKLYQGNPNAAEFETRLQSLKANLRTIAGGTHNALGLKDQRFATHMGKLPPEALDRLDVWFPEDSLQVEYSTGADGSSFRSIQEGSPGQKTAALLSFLLSYGEEPIILDQPEDDLDNHLIYDLIVQQLRTIKQRRQVIVITHNANIVVNGDAELVVALAARGGQTQIEAQGSLQEKSVRDTICKILEGGRVAFKRRYRRIYIEGTTKAVFSNSQTARR
jgi:predicted metal-dependent phosphoesterase TrpH/energy-coupling factor transporter ATP-binding protein EcfA2